MKYMFLVILGFVLVGCDEIDPNTNKIDGVVVGQLEKIEFEGHTYIVRNGYYKGGICHDENCKCKKVEVK